MGTPPQETSGPTQAFETDKGVIDQGLWVARDFFQNPMAHNSPATTIGSIEKTATLSLPSFPSLSKGLSNERKRSGRNRFEFKMELQRYPSGYPQFGVSLDLCWD